MQTKHRLWLPFLAGLLILSIAAPKRLLDAQTSLPFSRMWADSVMRHLEVPLAHASFSPQHVTADYYYRIPVRPIYQSYPVYSPHREPAGYFQSLSEKQPTDIEAGLNQVKTDSDWILLGEVVFYAPLFYNCCIVNVEDVRTPKWYEQTGTPVASDGTVPFMSYVIRERGTVELGTFSCGFCHTRVMPDGSIIRGAQGNVPLDRIWAYWMRKRETAANLLPPHIGLFGKPWEADPAATYRSMTIDAFAKLHEAIPPGVIARHRTSAFTPVQVPDLIGVQQRRYLDRTSLQTHKSIEDLMRYGALNQGADDLASFGGFVPGGNDYRELPAAASQTRYSDEQLYGLARYIYSLRPPANPNRFDAIAEEGQRLFEREGCLPCHTPPLYTNNRLLPVRGFSVPPEHRKLYEISPLSIDTDPTLALDTRRGTGYYKVPSLLGVWYRGPFHHNGRVLTLEDWFDAGRLRDDYHPTGFQDAGGKPTPVRGHEFGLRLSPPEKRALIAFLRTL